MVLGVVHPDVSNSFEINPDVSNSSGSWKVLTPGNLKLAELFPASEYKELVDDAEGVDFRESRPACF